MLNSHLKKKRICISLWVEKDEVENQEEKKKIRNFSTIGFPKGINILNEESDVPIYFVILGPLYVKRNVWEKERKDEKLT